MKTIVSIPHHEYPALVRDLVEAKLQHLAKYYNRIVSLRAVLERENEAHRIELVVNVGHGVTLVVDSRGPLLEATLDEALGRMTRTLTRHKGKIRSRRGKR
jgi:ribosomal subunit interface protein